MKIQISQPHAIMELGMRTNQEDSLFPFPLATEHDKLFVLCDGMGGHEHGEVASQTVCQALGEWYQTRAIHPLSKPQVVDALAYAYAQLDQKDDGAVKKMGTTLTLLYIGRRGVIAAHMGDSRIYHIRPNVGILYQSRDHSLAFDLYQAEEISYEEMKNFGQKNVITRAMTPGEDNRMRPDVIHITDIQPGDYFYMCSDGMLEHMSNNELVALLSADDPDGEKRQQLIVATANNQDNHTAWLIHIKDVVNEVGDEQLINEEPTARCNALNILPQTNNEVDIKIVDENDGVIVSNSKVVKRKRPLLKKIMAVLGYMVILIVTICGIFLYNNSSKKKTRRKPVPLMRLSNQNYLEKKNVKDIYDSRS